MTDGGHAPRSLRSRVVAGSLIWAALILTIGALILFFSVERILIRQFESQLNSRFGAVLALLDVEAEMPGALSERLTDPVYSQPFSGVYWQVERPDGTILSAPSLLDFQLRWPDAAGTQAAIVRLDGPQSPLLARVQAIRRDDGTVWTVAVAQSTVALSDARVTIIRGFALAYLVMGGLAVIGTLLVLNLLFRPLSQLPEDINRGLASGEDIDPSRFPAEVGPLVGELNHLLERNRAILTRTRRQAADLAHALKTPSLIIRNDIDRQGDAADLSDARAALDRIDALVARGLGRMQLGGEGPRAARAEVEASVARLLRAFDRPEGHLRFESDLEPGLVARTDPGDLEECLGNLVENATGFAHGRVRITARADTGDMLSLTVEDDGDGLPKDKVAEVLAPGRRLDVGRPGAGLGLTLVHDIAEAYGGTLTLGASADLGGLAARITLPRVRGQAITGARSRGASRSA
ncbi:sensor histidine kinase [Oceanomicrobium pacificus]|uniref:histidine kinase n=1 Tax=Oceanomicrobium pacificus TaxID=2692916 RepID=A0A6B0TMY2_9RHOB|nr:HAMP domain-containing sensor histidine kinase [Oceanomicrobium pacificus]MXU63929.1 hypothetical protein [Oceanomicrobium pacificus]